MAIIPVINQTGDTIEGSNVTSFNVNVSSHTDGDLLIVFICKDSSGAIDDHASFTKIQATDGTDDPNIWIGWRIASSEPSQYTFTADSEEWTGAFVVIDDGTFDPADPIDVSAAAFLTTQLSNTIICPSVTPTVADGLLLVFGCIDTVVMADAPFSPTGWTDLATQNSSQSSGQGTITYSMAKRDTGSEVSTATGTISLAADATDEWVGVTLNVKPPGDPLISAVADDSEPDTRTGVVITGTAFGATDTGSAKVEITDNATYGSGSFEITIPRTAWADTSITVDLEEDGTGDPLLNDLTPGTVYAYVTDSGGTRSVSHAFTLKTPGATWKANEGLDASYDVDTAFRIRFKILNSGGPEATPVFELWAQLNAGSYFEVTDTSTGGVQFELTSEYADGVDTDEQLLSGSETYITDNNAAKEQGGTGDISGGAAITGNAVIEPEYCLTMPTANIANDDTMTFEVRLNGGTQFGTYTDRPVITAISSADPTGTATQTLPSLTQAGVGVMQPSATAAQTLPSLTQSASLAEEFIATAVQTLPSITQVAAGLEVFTATGVQTLPAITQVAAGLEVFAATGVQTLPALTQVAAGLEVFTATGAQTLPAVTQAAVGVMQPSATGVQTLPSITQVAAGLEVFVATGVQTLPSITQVAVGVMQPSATGVQTLPSITQVAAGLEVFTATGVQTLPSLEQAGVGVMQPSATGVQTLPSITQVASGIHTIVVTGTSAQTLPSITQVAVGVMQPSATGVQTLPSITQVAAGLEVFTATGVQTLPAITQVASGTSVEDFTATGAQVLPSLTQVAAGLEIFTATGAQTLPSLEQAAVGVMQPSATGAQTLPAITQVAAGLEVFTATGVQVLPSLTQVAAGLEVFAATGAQTLPSLTQVATGLEIFTATGVQTLPAITQTGVGLMLPVGAAVQTLPSITQLATGLSISGLTGTAAQTLPGLLQSAQGLIIGFISSFVTVQAAADVIIGTGVTAADVIVLGSADVTVPAGGDIGV